MATPLQHRRGNTAVTNAFTGLNGELFINTDNHQINVHDGVTAGGFSAALAEGYAPGSILMADQSGNVQNTSALALVAANNTVIANSNLTVTGNLTIAGTTTIVNQEIVTSTEVVAGQLTANSGVSSTSTTTGALLVNGGAGVTGNLYATAAITNSVQANTVNAAAMTVNSVKVATLTDMLVFNLALG